MPRARRNGALVAILFLDLDLRINDAVATQGDICCRRLQRVSETVQRDRFGGAFGETVRPNAGDELPELETQPSSREVLDVMERPLHRSSDIRRLGEHRHQLLSRGGGDISALLKCADTALYGAKSRGRNAYQFFAAENERLCG